MVRRGVQIEDRMKHVSYKKLEYAVILDEMQGPRGFPFSLRAYKIYMRTNCFLETSYGFVKRQNIFLTSLRDFR